MNIEGSRHERVAIVITAYVIGFVTAFIGFGVTVSDTEMIPTTALQNTPHSAAVISTLPTEKNRLTAAVSAEGLVLYVDAEERLLAASNLQLDDTYNHQDGVFSAIVGYDISPDENFVYFCEKPTSESDSCKPFVYSVTNNIVYPVTISGDRVAFAATPHNVEWGTNGPTEVAGEAVDMLPR